MARSLPRIADSEWHIMKLFWKHSPRSAQEIIDALAGEVEWTPKTIKTLLNRLVKKEALGYEKQGRSYLYFSIIDEEKCKREEAQTFVKRVFDGALKPMLASFLEDSSLKPEELDEVRKILEQVKGDRS